MGMISAKRRRCSPVFVEGNLRTKIFRRFQAAWLAWKASANCPAGEAAWECRDFLASINSDGLLELVEKTGFERQRAMKPCAKSVRYEDESRRYRPAPQSRYCRALCLH